MLARGVVGDSTCPARAGDGGRRCPARPRPDRHRRPRPRSAASAALPVVTYSFGSSMPVMRASPWAPPSISRALETVTVAGSMKVRPSAVATPIRGRFDDLDTGQPTVGDRRVDLGPILGRSRVVRGGPSRPVRMPRRGGLRNRPRRRRGARPASMRAAAGSVHVRRRGRERTTRSRPRARSAMPGSSSVPRTSAGRPQSSRRDAIGRGGQRSSCLLGHEQVVDRVVDGPRRIGSSALDASIERRRSSVAMRAVVEADDELVAGDVDDERAGSRAPDDADELARARGRTVRISVPVAMWTRSPARSPVGCPRGAARWPRPGPGRPGRSWRSPRPVPRARCPPPSRTWPGADGSTRRCRATRRSARPAGTPSPSVRGRPRRSASGTAPRAGTCAGRGSPRRGRRGSTASSRPSRPPPSPIRARLRSARTGDSLESRSRIQPVSPTSANGRRSVQVGGRDRYAGRPGPPRVDVGPGRGVQRRRARRRRRTGLSVDRRGIGRSARRSAESAAGPVRRPDRAVPSATSSSSRSSGTRAQLDEGPHEGRRVQDRDHRHPELGPDQLGRSRASRGPIDAGLSVDRASSGPRTCWRRWRATRTTYATRQRGETAGEDGRRARRTGRCSARGRGSGRRRTRWPGRPARRASSGGPAGGRRPTTTATSVARSRTPPTRTAGIGPNWATPEPHVVDGHRGGVADPQAGRWRGSSPDRRARAPRVVGVDGQVRIAAAGEHDLVDQAGREEREPRGQLETRHPERQHSTTTAVRNPARPVVRMRRDWPSSRHAAGHASASSSRRPPGPRVVHGPERPPDRHHRDDRHEDPELRLDDRGDDREDRRPLRAGRARARAGRAAGRRHRPSRPGPRPRCRTR